MHLIQVNEPGNTISFTGEYRRDLETEMYHVYETIDGELLKFQKSLITFVSEKSTECSNDHINNCEQILIEPINEHQDCLIFMGIKHPIMNANKWCYYITDECELLHVNCRHFKCS